MRFTYADKIRSRRARPHSISLYFLCVFVLVNPGLMFMLCSKLLLEIHFAYFGAIINLSWVCALHRCTFLSLPSWIRWLDKKLRPEVGSVGRSYSSPVAARTQILMMLERISTSYYTHLGWCYLKHSNLFLQECLYIFTTSSRKIMHLFSAGIMVALFLPSDRKLDKWCSSR